MKKHAYLLLFLVLGIQLNAQNVDRSILKVGFYAAMPIGDASDLANVGLGFDLFHHWAISKKFDAGLTTGIQYFFGVDSTIDIGSTSVTTRGDDTIYLPAAALLRFFATKAINLGADIGYAFGLVESSESGFYYRPTLGIGVGNSTDLTASYTAIELEAGSWNTITLGLVVQF